MRGQLLLGIDLGTSGVKVTALDPGTLATQNYARRYRLHTPNPGFFELVPQEVEDALFGLIREEIPTDVKGLISAIGMSGLVPSLVPVDRQGNALANCLTNLDTRASSEAEAMERLIQQNALLPVLGRHALPKYMAPRIHWLRRSSPGVYKSATKFLQLKDYFILRLTGKPVTDPLTASNSLLLEIQQRAWSERLCHLGEIDPSRLPSVEEPSSIAGTLSAEAADRTGLAPHLPVAVGANDDALSRLAVGALQPHLGYTSTGSTTVFGLTRPAVEIDGPLPYEVSPGLAADTFNLTFINHGTGAMIRWLVEVIFSSSISGTAIANRYRELDRLAAAIPTGSNGLIVVPDFAGTGTGEYPRRSRCVFYGLSQRHTQAHLYRATMEGIALRLHRNLREASTVAGDLQAIRTTGGVTRSRLFRQIMADALGVPVGQTAIREAAAAGAAIMAGAAIGLIEDPYSLAANRIELADERLPQHEAHAGYLQLDKRVAELERRLFAG